MRKVSAAFALLFPALARLIAWLGELFAVVTDGKCGANVHCALRRDLFFTGRRLAYEVNMRLILAVLQQRGCFLETISTEGTGGIDIPSSRSILGLFHRFVSHSKRSTRLDSFKSCSTRARR